jgi:hypothetical protein
MATILNRAPKWAWYTAGGVVLAGGAFQIARKRSAQVTTADGSAVDGSGGAGATLGAAPSPAPGIVVPPVIIPGQQVDPLAGVQPLQDLYIGAVGGIISGWQDVAHGWQDVYTPLIAQNQSLIGTISTGFLDTNSAMLAIAQAGPPPASSPINSPVAAAPAVAAPVAAAPRCPAAFPEGAPPSCYRTITPTDCHCEGTGRTRKCWTRRLHDHQYQDGRVVTVSVDKVKDGC